MSNETLNLSCKTEDLTVNIFLSNHREKYEIMSYVDPLHTTQMINDLLHVLRQWKSVNVSIETTKSEELFDQLFPTTDVNLDLYGHHDGALDDVYNDIVIR
jgi:hypothetical protein